MTDQIAEVHSMLNIFKDLMTRLEDNAKLFPSFLNLLDTGC
jgi:hypothetical protein